MMRHQQYDRIGSLGMLKDKAINLVGLTLLACCAHISEPMSNQSLVEYCETRIVEPRQWEMAESDLADWNLTLTDSFGIKILAYRGLVHTRDPRHRQYGILETEFNESDFDITFFEARGDFVGDTHDESVRRSGEPGFVRFLSRKEGIPYRSLEPLEADTISYLAELHSVEEVQLFLILKRWHQYMRRGFSTKDAEGRLKRYISSIVELGESRMIAFPIQSLEDVSVAFENYWSDRSWKETESNWFNPLVSSEETGGLFLNEITANESHFRNVGMYRNIAFQIISGKKVFAAVGRNHVPLQRPALECVGAAYSKTLSRDEL